MKFRENEHIFLGVPILLLGTLCLGRNIHLLFQYHFSDKLFLFEAPNLLLMVNVLIATFSLILGVETMKGKLKVKISLIVFLAMLVSYILLNTIFNLLL